MQYRHKEAAERLKFERAGARMTIIAEGAPLASSEAVVRLYEGDYPSVAYFPRSDVDFSRLTPTQTKTICPFKGEASYFALCDAAGNILVDDVAWSYETPIEEASVIAGHLAFYPNKTRLVESEI